MKSGGGKEVAKVGNKIISVPINDKSVLCACVCFKGLLPVGKTWKRGRGLRRPNLLSVTNETREITTATGQTNDKKKRYKQKQLLSE